MTTRARPCLACAQRTPDADCGPADDLCAEAWWLRHDGGDHRRCERFSWPCQVAGDHPAVREAARASLDRTGRTLAVVCLVCTDDDGPRVLATFGDNLWSAKGLRNSHASRRHGLGVQEQKGIVYVTSREGLFL